MKAMKILAVLAAATVLAGPALGADDPHCPLPDHFEIRGWRLDVDERSRERGSQPDTRLHVDLVYTGAAPIVMVDGSVRLYDALGRSLDGAFFDPDLHATTGDLVGAQGWLRTDSRLPRIDPALVTAKVCIRGIVHADGTVRPTAEEVAAKEAGYAAEREAVAQAIAGAIALGALMKAAEPEAQAEAEAEAE